MIIIYLMFLVGFSLLLIKATDILTESLKELSKITKIGQFAITSLLLPLATSLPELVVSITSALEGKQTLALGTVLGSNIANLSLVIGGAAVIGGCFAISGEFLKMDIFSVFLAGVLPLMLLLDNQLSRTDGIVLLLVYGMYNFGIFRERHKMKVRTKTSRGLIQRTLTSPIRKRVNKWLVWMFLGAAILMFSADMMVKIGSLLAAELGVPIFLVGLFLVAAGTSLPELMFEIKAVRRNQVGMVLGALFGSVVINSTLVLGLTALINPIRLSRGLDAYLLAAAAFGVLFMLFWSFVKSKKKLERWEGLILLAVYFLFMMVEWWGK